MEIKVLGTGCCSSCGDLYDMVNNKVTELGLDATITKINDMGEIIAAGIISTPALMIDGKVVHAGGLPSEEDVTNWLK